jgi:serpin B
MTDNDHRDGDSDSDTKVVAALEALRSPGRPLPWPEPEQLRRRGRRRRRRVTAVRSAVAFGLAAAVTVTIVAVSRPEHRPYAEPPLAAGLQVRDRSGSAVELAALNRPAPRNPAAEAVTARAEADFTLKLLGKLQGNPAKNVLVSPSSLSNALAMLNYGARGETQRQIAALLGPAGSSAQSIAQGWSTLVADWATAAAANKIALSTANGVWLQRKLPLVASFSAALAEYFDSGVWQVDFDRNPVQAAHDLDAWVSRETHGKIPELLTADEVQAMLLVLVNAVYFKADWATPLPETSEGPFTTATGQVKSVPTMATGAGIASVTDDQVQAAQLPYRGGRFAALLIQPKHTSLAGYVASLTPDKLTGLIAGLTNRLRPNSGGLSMPQLNVASTMDLKPILQALGMTQAFSETEADLTGLTPRGGYVAFVKQKATLAVTPKGTTATAATAIGVSDAAANVQPKLAFDHPFLFVIRDTHTGAILFSAEINDPLAH